MSDYVNKIAPEHSRTSCDDDDLYNAAYGLDDFDGRGRCYRCTLLMAQAKARIEDAAAPAAPAADAGLVDALGYQVLFDAIAAATSVYANGAVNISVQAFRDALAAHRAQQVSVPDEMRSLAQRLREYNQNPHHINPMSEAFHILVADAANALSAACVPKEIAAAITWSEHLLFECGALTSTRAPSVHVYNKTFAAVNEARAMLNAAPAAPAADAGIVDMYRHLQKVTPYRFKKIQDASITDGGDVMYFHKDRFDAALLADMAAHCAAKGVV